MDGNWKENNKNASLNFHPYTPFFTSSPLYSESFLGISPYEFSDWRDETSSWKTTCYLHAGLNPCDTLVIKGPDTIRFLSAVCATNMDNFEVGRIKHGLIVDDQGYVMQDGVMMRTGEEEVITYWMTPMLNYYIDTWAAGKYDVTYENITGKVFLYQIGGPKSIDVIEAACGKDLRDVKHLRFIKGTIAGHEVTIARVGMAGTLAYEVHGAFDDHEDVYMKIFEEGEKYGLRRLGSHCYAMNHAENGFPQFGVHFTYPRKLHKEVMDYMASKPEEHGMWLFLATTLKMRGSAAGDYRNYIHNPYELGWGKMIKFDHDFVGKEALEKIKAEDKRTIVSLEWNADDIAEVFKSQFLGTGTEPYKYIEEPVDWRDWPDTEAGLDRDFVLNKAGEKIGLSFGRQNACYFRKMISDCCIDKAYAELGTEVYVLWGDPGQKQIKIRATVARYPYNNVLRSADTDVTKLTK